MAEFDLNGKKVAVLVENQYIPEEIRTYRQRFGLYDAEVHFMSNLWGQPSMTFVSEVEQQGQTPEVFTVNIDFRDVVLEEYAAVIIAANYVSVRLRYLPTW
jgi:protease I